MRAFLQGLSLKFLLKAWGNMGVELIIEKGDHNTIKGIQITIGNYKSPEKESCQVGTTEENNH